MIKIARKIENRYSLKKVISERTVKEYPLINEEKDHKKAKSAMDDLSN